MKLRLSLLVAAATLAVAQDNVAATASCEPHGDHWHCPSGVPEPTAPPAASPSPHADGDDHDHDHDHSHDGVSATASGVCEPHDDHWHCPPGVPEPTVAPGTAALTVTAAPTPTPSHSDHDGDDHHHDDDVTATTCEPHGDHWHCPSGVAEPTTAPAASGASGSAVSSVSASLNASASAAASTSPLPPAQQTANAAAAAGLGGAAKGVVAVLVGALAWAL
ncbi:predicted protein [Plenodomus lingam JN3]|uniref:Predicted protein n=1 Tax=Leptosphaeria maculans (strain JN3 / isolate v23.1.3 / race Av1-4-5-6-7-8) TaxID=985895 RepID=E5A0E7_LEPMJ|nr:predicted protein [Plenodomus lingam JN3]CBX97007.1 predicted protein [Plenodomus lingam JN3]